MNPQRDQEIANVLPPALELMTAFQQSTVDPGLYWQALQRILSEAAGDADPAQALAKLTFGLSALAGVLLDQLAQATGREPTQLLAEIYRTYLDT